MLAVLAVSEVQQIAPHANLAITITLGSAPAHVKLAKLCCQTEAVAVQVVVIPVHKYQRIAYHVMVHCFFIIITVL
jgi:hypothetical protein